MRLDVLGHVGTFADEAARRAHRQAASCCAVATRPRRARSSGGGVEMKKGRQLRRPLSCAWRNAKKTADAVYSRTSYSNATPSESCSSSHLSAALHVCQNLHVIDVTELLGGIDVNEHGHRSLASLRRPPRWGPCADPASSRINGERGHQA